MPHVSRHRDACRESVWLLLGSARTPSAPLRCDAAARRRVKAQPRALETRVLARKAELIAEIIEYKKNSSRFGAAEAVDRIKVRLADLAQIVKDGVGDGWANVGPQAKLRFDEWLAR